MATVLRRTARPLRTLNHVANQALVAKRFPAYALSQFTARVRFFSTVVVQEIDPKRVEALHDAIKENNIPKTKQLLAGPDKRELASAQHKYTGHTAFHAAAKYGCYNMLTNLVVDLGPEVYRVSTQTDVFGLLPIDLLKQNARLDVGPEHEYEKFLKLVLLYTTKHEMIPLAQVLDEEKVAKDVKDEGLKLNLVLSARAINYSRYFLKESSSHPNPGAKNKSPQVRTDINSKINKVRDGRPKTQDPAVIHSYYINTFVALGAANCGGHAHLTANNLTKLFMKMGLNVPVEIYVTENGLDHELVVCGRDQKSDPSDHKTWGDTAAVADSWAGETYPASQIPQRLKGYKHIHHKNERTGEVTEGHALVEFNPKHNRLVLRYQFIPEQTKDGLIYVIKKYEPKQSEEQEIVQFIRMGY